MRSTWRDARRFSLCSVLRDVSRLSHRSPFVRRNILESQTLLAPGSLLNHAYTLLDNLVKQRCIRVGLNIVLRSMCISYCGRFYCFTDQHRRISVSSADKFRTVQRLFLV